MSEFGPYPDVQAHLRDELWRVWLSVEYQIRRRWALGALPRIPDGGGFGVWTSDNLIDAFRAAHAEHGDGQGPPPGPQTDPASVRVALEAHAARVDARIGATLQAGARLPIADIAGCFKLTRRQLLSLMFALMPELDPNLLVAYRYLSHDPSCRGLDGRLLAMLVYETPESRAHLSRDLSPTSPLLYYRLLEQDEPGPAHDSALFRRLRPAARLVQMLSGEDVDLDPQVSDFAEVREGEPPALFPASVVEQAEAVLGADDVMLVIQGVKGVGRKLLLQVAAARRRRRLLLIDGRPLLLQPPSMLRGSVRSLLREARLLDALPVVPNLDAIVAAAGDREELPAFLPMLSSEHFGPIAVTVGRERTPRLDLRPVVHITLEVPSLSDRTTLWQRQVPTLSGADAEGLAARFVAPGGIISLASRAATAARRAGDGPPDAAALDRAVRGQLHDRLSRLGRRLDAPYGFEDLVVDEDTLATLHEIVGALRERRKVRERWGFRGAPGVSVLFSGDPGVGKTMSATVLGRSLDLAVYEIDLSRVVSKWLGETEKNLSEVFDAAEPGHVVLLFNEADSLFGKRTTDVKTANDRHANMETNYLLQRLERFGGLAILTTNLGKSIDPAFRRRFAYDVQFSFPTPEMRAELWRRAIPKQAEAVDIDHEELAHRFELSGGFIKVAMERTAFVAASAGSPITMEGIVTTVERMYRERGKLTTVGKLE